MLIIADGGLGISGFDLETARRYGQPIVAVLWNNSSWGPSFDEMPFLKGRTDLFEISPDQRYDRMFELMDCHGEYVELRSFALPSTCTEGRQDRARRCRRRPHDWPSEPWRKSARLDPRVVH